VRIPSLAALSLLCALPALPAAAGTVEWDVLLGSHVLDIGLVTAKERVKELGEAGGVQLWDELEVRYAAKRSDLRKQEIDLRVTPPGFGEFGANRRLVESRTALGDARIGRKTTDALRDRYRLGLRWMLQERRARFHRDMFELSEQRIAVLAKLAGDVRFDPKDLVETQVARVEWVSRMESDRWEHLDALERLKELVPGADSLHLEGALLSPRDIEARLAALPGNPSDSFPDLAVAGRELALEEAKTNQKISSTRRWVSYLEAGYTHDVDENKLERQTLRDNISFGAGIRVPLFDGNAREIARQKADLAAARLDFQDQREELQRDLQNLRLTIGGLVRQLAVLDSFAAKVDAGGLFAQFAARSGGDPLLVLQARETSLESAWKIEQLRFEILQKYLDILDLTGALVRHPDRNLLLADTPLLASGTSPVP